MKKKISVRALEQRIGRCLRKESKSLHRAKLKGETSDELGPYYIVNETTNVIKEAGMSVDNLVNIARKKGIMKAWEEVE